MTGYQLERFTTTGRIQDVNATDEVADGAFMDSSDLVPVYTVNLGVSGGCKQISKSTIKDLEY